MYNYKEYFLYIQTMLDTPLEIDADDNIILSKTGIVLFKHDITSIVNKYAVDTIEILERYKYTLEDGSTIILGADQILEMVGKIRHGYELNDINVLSTFLREYKSLPEKYKNTNFHININPLTLLNEKYWNLLINMFINNSPDKKLYENVFFEILEIDTLFYPQDIKVLNSRTQFLNDNFGIRVGLDDCPSKSNNFFMLRNIKGIDFVKIDTQIVLKHARGVTNEEVFKELIKGLIREIRKYHPDIKIIIEGVETLSMYGKIKNDFPEITHIQGYIFGKPIELIKQNN